MFLRRYVTWCIRREKHGPARAHAGLLKRYTTKGGATVERLLPGNLGGDADRLQMAGRRH